ncbi:2,3-diaminopropionate biosynthesis protein SbnB [Prauserella cavernicola]|uniref:2,3-diaminopropionate biosynthesis protein SbnB n=1 Tax=Prauserella cavernicola TaxID=2800127 RepID=A0A934QZ11_9PSEU|nr:2,3-diaminopropionate biosynthesis protein SbnB [Prauserella cavernicola]MBK1787883.1 2,3-diaminopropionate biosynthesis protein SbnB [Prauserella cavernicola]
MLILRKSDVLDVLDGSERAVRDAVSGAYVAHAEGRTVVPHSTFLRFPDEPGNRIIALPAYVGGAHPVASLKWIASFPGNIDRGVERASAAILLNSMTDGRPVALLEGSVISARRTAASAAVAARELTSGAPEDVRSGVSLVGCGVINFEVLRFLRSEFPELGTVTIADLSAERARRFGDRITAQWPDLSVTVVEDAEAATRAHRLISIATTASSPYLSTRSCEPGSVVLHVSLRDLAVDSIIGARNVVDDADHVCRAATSLDLAQQAVGHRDFVHAEVGDILAGTVSVGYDRTATTVFSPFGLGALDAAVAAFVVDTATERELGTSVPGFLE